MYLYYKTFNNCRWQNYRYSVNMDQPTAVPHPLVNRSLFSKFGTKEFSLIYSLPMRKETWVSHAVSSHCNLIILISLFNSSVNYLWYQWQYQGRTDCLPRRTSGIDILPLAETEVTHSSQKSWENYYDISAEAAIRALNILLSPI